MSRLSLVPLFVVFMWGTESYDFEKLRHSDIMHEHLDWMLRLEDEGVLFAAGPLDREVARKDGDPLGMYVLAARDRAEAEAIAAQEPFARAGYRTYQVRSFLLNEGTGRHNARTLVQGLERTPALDSPVHS